MFMCDVGKERVSLLLAGIVAEFMSKEVRMVRTVPCSLFHWVMGDGGTDKGPEGKDDFNVIIRHILYTFSLLRFTFYGF